MRKPTEFENQVYKFLNRVPRGFVTTYGDIANAMGHSGAQAVGLALNRNPFAPKVPCHRVVPNSGKLGGYALGPTKKAKLLKAEGVEIKKGLIVDFDKIRYRF